MKDYKLTKDIQELCYYLEFYDKYGFFPFEKKRIDITLTNEALMKIKNKNKSELINSLICSN